MKGMLRIAGILSWINLLFWGWNVLLTLLAVLPSGNMPFIIGVVLLASVPLHGYAALQLHKSIRKPEIKLSHQTPAGIRFVGLVALLFGLVFILCGLVMARNSQAVLDMVRQGAFMKDMYDRVSVADIRRYGIIIVVLGLITIVNVILNLRLLRWYYLVHQSDAS